MLGLFDVFAAREARLSPPANPLAARRARACRPQPRLQVHPVKDSARAARGGEPSSTHYGWVDKSAGVGAHSDRPRHGHARSPRGQAEMIRIFFTTGGTGDAGDGLQAAIPLCPPCLRSETEVASATADLSAAASPALAFADTQPATLD